MTIGKLKKNAFFLIFPKKKGGDGTNEPGERWGRGRGTAPTNRENGGGESGGRHQRTGGTVKGKPPLPRTARKIQFSLTITLSCVVRVACHGAAWRSRVRSVRSVRKVRVKKRRGLASPLHPLALCVRKVSVRGSGIPIIHCGRSTALHGLRCKPDLIRRSGFVHCGRLRGFFPLVPLRFAWGMPFHPFTALTAL